MLKPYNCHPKSGFWCWNYTIAIKNQGSQTKMITQSSKIHSYICQSKIKVLIIKRYNCYRKSMLWLKNHRTVIKNQGSDVKTIQTSQKIKVPILQPYNKKQSSKAKAIQWPSKIKVLIVKAYIYYQQTAAVSCPSSLFSPANANHSCKTRGKYQPYGERRPTPTPNHLYNESVSTQEYRSAWIQGHSTMGIQE